MPEKSDPPWAEANRIMMRNNFGQDKMRLSRIWAAKRQECPKCKQAPGKPCLNLSRHGRYHPQFTKNPHSERIDWEMLARTLKERGYE